VRLFWTAYHHGRCRIQLLAKGRHCDGTGPCIQVRVEVRKTVQPVRERNDGPVWRDARSKPQELGIERLGTQTSRNGENPHGCLMPQSIQEMRSILIGQSNALATAC